MDTDPAPRSDAAPRRIVLTGGPHAGKTTLLKELEQRGERVVREAAMGVIAELRRSRGNDGANAWRREHADEFQELIAKQQLETESALDLPPGERVFFDRGLFDGIAYARLAGVAPPPSVLAARGTHRYDLIVLCRLILPFKERPHSGRTSDRARAEAIERGLEAAWSECGYPVLHLPSNLAPRERAELLLERIAVWPPGLRPGRTE